MKLSRQIILPLNITTSGGSSIGTARLQPPSGFLGFTKIMLIYLCLTIIHMKTPIRICLYEKILQNNEEVRDRDQASVDCCPTQSCTRVSVPFSVENLRRAPGPVRIASVDCVQRSQHKKLTAGRKFASRPPSPLPASLLRSLHRLTDAISTTSPPPASPFALSLPTNIPLPLPASLSPR